jgi:hypothetical protein
LIEGLTVIRNVLTAGVGLVTTFVMANAANAGFCGVSGESPAEIQSNVIKNRDFKRDGATSLYVAYANKRSLMTLTFTTAANRAHPGVACRRVVQKNGAVYVLTNIKCGSSKSACDAMAREFNALDAQMKRQMKLLKP